MAGTGSRIAQVVPAIPSFSVDDGFSYAIPEEMELSVGSIVRVPLGGRRVRGYVTGLRSGDTGRLRSVLRMSSQVPVFNHSMLESLRALAVHYVAPLAVVLAKTAPPNLPRAMKQRRGPAIEWEGDSPLPEVTGAVAGRRHPRAHFLLGRKPWDEVVLGLVAPVLKAGRSAMVVMPTVSETTALASRLDDALPGRVISAYSALEAKVATGAWSRAALEPGRVLIGTREVAFWPMADLGLGLVLGEGRKGMKDKSTPTFHARHVLRRRSAVERFGLAMLGIVPSSETIAAGTPVVRMRGTRSWPLVEVVDRTEEPPGSGFVTARALAAVRAVSRRGGRCFVFTHRRGYAPAFRCVRCRLARTCTQCGARADRGDECPRCGSGLGACLECGGKTFEPLGAGAERIAEQLASAVPVGAVGSEAMVWVGTERDLPAVSGVDLAVVVDADGLIHAPHYRAGEEALHVLARVAETVGRGAGRRCMVQTALPRDPVVAALRHGDPLKYLDESIAERARTGLPPVGEVIVVEVDNPDQSDSALHDLVGGRAELFGPAERDGRHRWLIQGTDLRPVRVGLRRVVQSWRDAGRRVRVDVDPLEL